MKQNNIRHLISILYEKNDWSPAVYLADCLHTTARTIRNYVSEINSNSTKPLILSGKNGYRWNSDTKDLYPFSISSHKAPDSVNERVLFIVRKLAYHDSINTVEGLSFSQLANTLYLSDRAFETDLVRVKNVLKQFNLTLQSKNQHLSIHGNEYEKRRLIAFLISSYDETGSLPIEKLQIAFPEINTSQLLGLLINTLEQYGLEAGTFHMSSLLLNILIQFSRVSHGHFLFLEKDGIDIVKQTNEHKAAEMIAKQIQSLLDICLSLPEINYLAMLLLCTCFPKDCSNVTASDEITSCIRHMEHHTQLDFSDDLFPEKITEWIRRFRFRKLFGIGIPDPMEKQIRSSAPLEQDLAAWLLTGIISKTEDAPTRSEVSYLTIQIRMYIEQHRKKDNRLRAVLLAPTEYGIDEMFKKRLVSSFWESLSLERIYENTVPENLSDYDICISLFPLRKREHTITVSALLTDSDKMKISQEISLINNNKCYSSFLNYLRCYSSHDYFERDSDYKSEKEAISEICKKLSHAEVIDPSIEEEIFLREKADTTSFYNQIAIPHYIGKKVKKNVIYLVLNDRPIKWGKRDCNLIIFAVMQRELYPDFCNFYEQVINLFCNQKNMDRVKRSMDYDSFLKTIEQIKTT